MSLFISFSRFNCGFGFQNPYMHLGNLEKFITFPESTESLRILELDIYLIPRFICEKDVAFLKKRGKLI